MRFIPIAYGGKDPQESAMRLVLALRPDWANSKSSIKFTRCTDGITNTLLKVTNEAHGVSEEDAEKDAFLLRAYGAGTHVLIDRQREAENHELLMMCGLAPELLARFENGMLYRFIRGTVTTTEDLSRPDIYLAVARRLAQWHAIVPCLPATRVTGEMNGHHENGNVKSNAARQNEINTKAPGKLSPNMWTVMQKWVFALPVETEAQRARQIRLQDELDRLVKLLSQRPGLGENGVGLPIPPVGRQSRC